MTAPELSVIVMGYRDEATIVEAVGSVLSQVDDASIEVVVVTSGGDRSAARVRAAHPEVLVIESPSRLLPGGARNVGVAATTGEFVAFLAADCRAESGWVAGRLGAHRAGYDAVGSAVSLVGRRTGAAWASHYLLFPSRLPGRSAGPLPPRDDGGHGLSLRRSLLERLGRFDESTRIGEDTLITRRLADWGIPVWYEPTVRAGHPAPPSLAGLLREQADRGARRARSGSYLHPRGGDARLVAVAAVHLVWRLRWAFRRVWDLAPGDRGRLVLVAPWMVAGATAGQVGWARQVLTERRRPATGRSGRVAPPAPVRRRPTAPSVPRPSPATTRPPASTGLRRRRRSS